MSPFKILTTIEYLRAMENLEPLKGTVMKIIIPDDKVDISLLNSLAANNIQYEFIQCSEEDGLDFNVGWIMARTLQGNNALLFLTDKEFKPVAMHSPRGIIRKTLQEAKEELARVDAEGAVSERTLRSRARKAEAAAKAEQEAKVSGGGSRRRNKTIADDKAASEKTADKEGDA